jgi:pyruvate dehydrogenase E2 component (dihydrolipoamide acetyltransferase)
MLPDRQNQVRVRANFEGEVEVLVKLGERLFAGQPLVVIEGAGQVERLATRKPGTVVQVLVETGSEVKEGTLLLVVQEEASAQAN